MSPHRIASSLIILEGHPTLTKLPSIASRISGLQHPVYASLSDYEAKIGALHQSASSSELPKFHFLTESPFSQSLKQLETSLPMDSTAIPQSQITSTIMRTKQWKNQQAEIFDNVKMIYLTVDGYVACRRVAYEWEWTGGAENLKEKERYKSEEAFKEQWDSYYEQGERSSLWDMKIPSDDARQSVWILLDKLGVEFEYKKFERHFDPDNKIDKDGKFRGASFGKHDFL